MPGNRTRAVKPITRCYTGWAIPTIYPTFTSLYIVQFNSTPQRLDRFWDPLSLLLGSEDFFARWKRVVGYSHPQHVAKMGEKYFILPLHFHHINLPFTFTFYVHINFTEDNNIQNFVRQFLYHTVTRAWVAVIKAALLIVLHSKKYYRHCSRNKQRTPFQGSCQILLSLWWDAMH
jgi:hypothetical protein